MAKKAKKKASKVAKVAKLKATLAKQARAVKRSKKKVATAATTPKDKSYTDKFGRKISPAARRKMSLAAKARWAKKRAEKKELEQAIALGSIVPTPIDLPATVTESAVATPANSGSTNGARAAVVPHIDVIILPDAIEVYTNGHLTQTFNAQYRADGVRWAHMRQLIGERTGSCTLEIHDATTWFNEAITKFVDRARG